MTSLVKRRISIKIYIFHSCSCLLFQNQKPLLISCHIAFRFLHNEKRIIKRKSQLFQNLFRVIPCFRKTSLFQKIFKVLPVWLCHNAKRPQWDLISVIANLYSFMSEINVDSCTEFLSIHEIYTHCHIRNLIEMPGTFYLLANNLAGNLIFFCNLRKTRALLL